MNKPRRKGRTFEAYLMECLRNPQEALAYLEASIEFGNKRILRSVYQIAESNKWEIVFWKGQAEKFVAVLESIRDNKKEWSVYGECHQALSAYRDAREKR